MVIGGEPTNRFKAGSNRDLFCIVSKAMVQKNLMFLHRVNNTENNIKQNIYTGMKVISLIAPLYCI